MNKVYHTDCFNCTQCGKVLNPDRFMEKHGKAYCEHDFNQLFLPKCYVCAKTVFEVGSHACLFMLIGFKKNIFVTGSSESSEPQLPFDVFHLQKVLTGLVPVHSF